MAQALLARRLAGRGIAGSVHSAGILGAGIRGAGQRPPPEAISAMAAYGLSTGSHRSRQVTTADLVYADVVLGMARDGEGDDELARVAVLPLFLAERTEPATALLLGASLFTIAIAAVIRK